MEGQQQAADHAQTRLPPGGAARLAWRPISFGAAQSISARSRGTFGADIVRRHQAWYHQLARRAVRPASLPGGPPAFSRRIEPALTPVSARSPTRELSLLGVATSSTSQPEIPLARFEHMSASRPGMRSAPDSDPAQPLPPPVGRSEAEPPDAAVPNPPAVPFAASAARSVTAPLPELPVWPEPLVMSRLTPRPRPGAVEMAHVASDDGPTPPSRMAAPRLPGGLGSPTTPRGEGQTTPAIRSGVEHRSADVVSETAPMPHGRMALSRPSGGSGIPMGRNVEGRTRPPARSASEHRVELSGPEIGPRALSEPHREQVPVLRTAIPSPLASSEHDRTAPSASDPSALPYLPTPVQTLIERTVRPVPVPGLEIRVIERAPRGAQDEPAARSNGDADAGVPPRPAPTPSAAPSLNIDAVADKVYHLLQRRQRFERERKGRY